jgi:hypothetical protein
MGAVGDGDPSTGLLGLAGYGYAGRFGLRAEPMRHGFGDSESGEHGTSRVIAVRLYGVADVKDVPLFIIALRFRETGLWDDSYRAV